MDGFFIAGAESVSCGALKKCAYWKGTKENLSNFWVVPGLFSKRIGSLSFVQTMSRHHPWKQKVFISTVKYLMTAWSELAPG